MRIYFRDGRLDRNHPFVYMIDASDGVTKCTENLEFIRNADRDSSVYTNCPEALNGRYCWDESKNKCGLYLERNGEWVNASDMTDKKMRSELNFKHLYLAGEFWK